MKIDVNQLVAATIPRVTNMIVLAEIILSGDCDNLINAIQVFNHRCEILLLTLHFLSQFIPSCDQNVLLVLETMTRIRDISSRFDSDSLVLQESVEVETPFIFKFDQEGWC